MRVGFVGLGKLGLPVAMCMASRGIEVWGYDPKGCDFVGACEHEEGFCELFNETPVDRTHFGPLEEVVANTDTIFVAVQTPHEPRFEGVTPLPQERADFDYTFLRNAVEDIVRVAGTKPLTLAVISTVLPGTMAREIAPSLPGNISLVYNPSFIAMGTVVRDFFCPEFVLLGGDDDGKVESVYRKVRPEYDGDVYQKFMRFCHTSIPNAELIKVAYNTFIGLKIAFANTLMEVCHKTDCDVDEVTGALKQANRRLISGAYMDGGMGDGGGCHPRDNIALSWLARELDLSHDFFHDTMKAREDQTRWLCSLVHYEAVERKLPIGILGEAYKPGSHLTTGSPARLAKCILHDRFGWRWGSIVTYDPHTESCQIPSSAPRVWLVGCNHPEFAEYRFSEGDVVIDPFRYIPDQEGVEVIRVGERSASHDRTTPASA